MGYIETCSMIGKILIRMKIKVIIVVLIFVSCTKNSDPDCAYVIEREYNSSFRIGQLCDSIRTGNWKEFRNYKLFSETHYENGVPNGEFIAYSICNGKVIEKGFYKNGDMYGLWEWYKNDSLVYLKYFSKDTAFVLHQQENLIFSDNVAPPLPDIECLN